MSRALSQPHSQGISSHHWVFVTLNEHRSPSFRPRDRGETGVPHIDRPFSAGSDGCQWGETEHIAQHRQSPVAGELIICVPSWAESPELRDPTCPPLSPVPGMGLTSTGAPRETTWPEGPQRCGVETPHHSVAPARPLTSLMLRFLDVKEESDSVQCLPSINSLAYHH